MNPEITANRKRPRTYDPNLPVVTVVTVVFNRKDAVRKTMESVVRQRYSNLEYIIVDGGSTDGTLDVIREYDAQVDLWISERDKGIYDAMNKGIGLATGDWIIFMNSGDTFFSDTTLMLFAEVDTRNADIVYGETVIDFGTFQTPYKILPLNQMWKGTPFCHQATFARTTLQKEFRFDTSFKLSADYDFLFKSYTRGKKFQYVDRVICLFEGDQGASKKQFINATRELFQSSIKHDSRSSHWLYFKFYMAYLRILVQAKDLLGEKLVFRAKKMFQGQKA